MSEEDPTEDAGHQTEGQPTFADTYSQAPEIYKEAWEARAEELGIPVTELSQQEIHSVYDKVGVGFEIAETPTGPIADSTIPPVERWGVSEGSGLPREPTTEAYKPTVRHIFSPPNPNRPAPLGDRIPQGPTTVAYKPPLVEQPSNRARTAAPLGPEPAPFRMENVEWEKPSETVKTHSEEPPMFPNPEHFPDVKYFNNAGELEEGWQRVRVSDTGDMVIRRLNPGGGSETKFVPVERYEEMQARETKSAGDGAKTESAASPVAPEAASSKEPSALEKALVLAQKAAEAGNTEDYVNKVAELITQLSEEAKKGGVGVEAQTKLQEKAFGEKLDAKEHAQQAARDMLQIHNIEELRDKISRSGAKKEELINEHLRIGTPLEAADDVKGFIRSMISLSSRRFDEIKDQLKVPAETDEEETENISGKLDLSAEYQVEINNGLGEMAGGYKVTAVYIENGKTFVDLEKPGTDKDDPAKDALLRTHLPATLLLKWQETSAEKKVTTDGDEAATEVIHEVVNPYDPVQVAEAAQRGNNSLEAARRKRAEEARDRENSKRFKRAFSFMRERTKSIREKGLGKRENAKRLAAILAIATNFNRDTFEALAAAGLASEN